MELLSFVTASNLKVRSLGGFLGACFLLAGVAAQGQQLDTHTVQLDSNGKLVPWTTNAYDRVMFLSWDFMKNRVPVVNGFPVSYLHSEYRTTTFLGSAWPNNPAGKNAMLSDSALLYYAYSGDNAVINLMKGMLNFQLSNGTTPTNYAWARVPWSTAAAGSTNYGNDSLVEGVGVLEPDKVGELGFHGYLRFYQLTDDTNYLNAALSCANILAARVRAGSATVSPWPFRVFAQTGATAYQEEYCANVIGPVRLFDELIRLGLGDTNAYQNARQLAWNWLMTYPVTNQVWANYFEDIQPRPNDIGNLNQYNPGQTVRFLLENPALNSNWYHHSTNLLGFIETTFGGTNFGESGLQYGARVISEQIAYKYKMASHTGRFGANYALLYSLTGDLDAKDKAYRSLNWATYMCRTNGVVIEGPAELAQNEPCWFTDGHGDYVRHFMVALGAIPEWSPEGQNHITRSTSVIKSVLYDPSGTNISYTTFDNASMETLRVKFNPTTVTANGIPLPLRPDLNQPGWTYTSTNGVMRIRHDNGKNIQIGSTPPVTVLGVPPQTALQIANNGFKFTLSANIPGVYAIERTQNFTNWLPVAEIAYTNGFMELTVTNVTSVGACSYRAARK